MKRHNLMSLALMGAVLGGGGMLLGDEMKAKRIITADDLERIEKAKQKRARKAQKRKLNE